MTYLKQTFTITQEQTASNMGSGDLDVLATPALIAMLENTAKTLLSSQLSPAQTSVGIHIQLAHKKASAVGSNIQCEATLTEQGKLFAFSLRAIDMAGNEIASGTHQRAIVDIEGFMGKLKQ